VNGGAPCTIKYAEGTPGQPDYYPWWNVSEDGPDGHKFTNASGEGGGTADLFSQTKNSVNCAFLRLLTSVGPPKVREMAARLGLTRPVGRYLSIGIGETQHSPLEMATVYSSFADDGIRHDPVFITRIEDSEGRVVYRAPGGKRVLTSQVARTVTDVLSHVTEGTAPKAKLADRPIAGKTGTRDNSDDAWFAGYTPQLVAVVWMGDPASSQHAMTDVGGIQVFGGTYPAIMWQKFMTSALSGQSVIDFTKPDETLWPAPTRVNPGGGRDAQSSGFSNFSPTTSTTLPVDSTTTSTEPTTTSSSPPVTTTPTAPPPP
jgi:penicillin-binding protein 1A